MAIVEDAPREHEQAFRCAPWTQAQGVDPVGSAVAFDALLLVEWPLPWPSDVSEIPELADAVVHGGARVMTVVPRADDGGDGLVRVVHRRRTGTHHLAGVDHRVPRSQVPELLATILAAPQHDHLELPSAVGESPADVLVCAHGRRDACCGRWGTLLHVELAARWSGVRVWRCSHTGGHRYAPTAITLPDGRAWAYVDPDLLDQVVERRGDVAALMPHDRGNSALDPWAQVVERALFAREGWSWLERDLTAVTTEVADDRQRAQVTLTWDGGAAGGEVEISRVLPVLVCGEPPERATKSSPEYRLVSLDPPPTGAR
jgi:hypothetical protein